MAKTKIQYQLLCLNTELLIKGKKGALILITSPQPRAHTYSHTLSLNQ